MLERINARRTNEKAEDLEIQSAMQGKKIKLPRVNVKQERKEEKADPIKDKKAMSVLERSLARKQEEREARGK